MEVTEQTAEGLERRFTVKVPAAELDAKLTARLADIKGKVNLKGFRCAGYDGGCRSCTKTRMRR